MPVESEAACDLATVPAELRISLFRLCLLQRLFEERVMILYRQGKISGSVYTGRGQEAVAAAAGLALQADDVVAPLNRELACHFARGVTPFEVFCNFLGRASGPTFGRDGNMHFGVPAKGVFPLVSMLGNLVPVTVGAAATFKRRCEPRVAMTFFGEGAFSVGDVHEGLNLAGVWKAPAVFIAQSNHFSYSTVSTSQMVNTNLAARIEGGWTIPCERVDGTDAIATYDVIRRAVEHARAGDGPRAVEAVTLRLHGHAAHDAGTYVSEELRTRYASLDPVDRLRARLAQDGLGAEAESVEREAEAAIAEALERAQREPVPDPGTIVDGVYANPIGRRAAERYAER